MCLKSVLVILLFAGLSACASRPPVARESAATAAVAQVPPPHETPAQAPDWNYPEDEHWGEGCRPSLQQQSPIDLRNVETTRWDESYVVTQATLDPYERNVVFMPSQGPSLTFNPTVGERERQVTYTPIGFHFHNGSEHRIDGNPLIELHIKAADAAGNVVVFAVLWAGGASESDPTLAAATASLGTQNNEPRAVDLGRVMRRFAQEPFYSYVGSLTTPPCTRGIRFFVLKNPIRTSATLIGQLTTALVRRGVSRENVRAPQPLVAPPPLIYLVEPRRAGS